MKKILSLFVLLSQHLFGWQDAETIDGIGWWYEWHGNYIDGYEAIITSVVPHSLPLSGGVIVPSVLGNCPVIGIGHHAFSDGRGRDITSVTIPSSVSIIYYSAFYGCSSLTSVMMAEGVTQIDSTVFYMCGNLLNFNIPRSVTSIGADAFKGTQAYNEAADGVFIRDNWVLNVKGECPENVNLDGIKGIANNAFYCCNNLKSVKIPENITYIGGYVFYMCPNLTSVSLPSGVETIWTAAFAGCEKLKDIVIPENLTRIGNEAFIGCRSLSNVTIPKGLKIIASESFCGCGLTNLVISKGVEKIETYAFANCSSLPSVTIPEGVLSIENGAFYECSSLVDFSIPSSVTSIEDYTFYGCSSLTNLVISNSITSIGNYAFAMCTNLMKITIPHSVTQIDSNAFAGCPATMVVSSINQKYRSDGTMLYTKDGKEVLWCSAAVSSVKIPSSVTVIGDSAFNLCSALVDITIPSSVTKIGKYAFWGTHSLKTVYVSKGDTERIKRLLAEDDKLGYPVTRLKFVEMTSDDNQIETQTELEREVESDAQFKIGEDVLSKAVEPKGEFKAESAVMKTGVIVEGGRPKATVQVKVGKGNTRKGISKVSITVIDMNGKKYTGKAEVKIGSVPAILNVAVKKWGDVSFTLADNGFGSDNVVMFNETHTEEAIAKFTAGDMSMFSGVKIEYLPNELVLRTDKKWKVVAKAGKLKYVKPNEKRGITGGLLPMGNNISALKLTYAAKTSTFKGSFKVWTFDEAKKKLKGTSAKITGIVAVGDGYGQAVVKKGVIGTIVVR